jgi:hypothetical protein
MNTPTVSDFQVTLAYIQQNIDAIAEFAQQFLNENYFEDDDVFHSYGDRVDLNFIRDEDNNKWRCFAYPVVNGDPSYDYEVAIPVDTDTYKVVRFYKDISRANKVILTGLTLQDAKEHCKRDDTHSDDWFDGYEKEGK